MRAAGGAGLIRTLLRLDLFIVPMGLLEFVRMGVGGLEFYSCITGVFQALNK